MDKKNKMTTLYCDYALEYGLGFQDPASNKLYAIIDLHDRIIFFCIILLSIVCWFLVSAFTNKDHLPYLAHGNTIELIWTITPAII
jgi:heme/copper-type cytochrome/quinol oxidase subunit 2